jgi:hypothetical protein
MPEDVLSLKDAKKKIELKNRRTTSPHIIAGHAINTFAI